MLVAAGPDVVGSSVSCHLGVVAVCFHSQHDISLCSKVAQVYGLIDLFLTFLREPFVRELYFAGARASSAVMGAN